MRITGLDAWTVAIPFRAPIFSAYGVSYPARIRTFVRLTTDVGATGIGETGVSATHRVRADEQLRALTDEIAPLIVGESPHDYLALLQKLRFRPESIAIELACWDLMGKAAGVPVYRLLGGHGYRDQVPVAGYFFFRAPDREGRHAVDLDNCVSRVVEMIDTAGFETVKLKLGVYPPDEEVDAVGRIRTAIGRRGLRIDPNGCWSLPTAKRMLHRLDPLGLDYVEEPIKFVPARTANSTQAGVPSLDTPGLAHLRMTCRTPIAADGCYRIDMLRQIDRAGAADVVLGDIQGSGGIRGLDEFFTVARALNLAATLHSGTELGVQQAAKLHVAAAHPEIRLAGDAIYPDYVDDVLVGGKLPVLQGKMAVPQAPGLGVELDEEKLAQYELTPARHAEFDRYWQEIKDAYDIGPAGSDLLVRHF